MKKILIILASLSMFFISCNKEKVLPEGAVDLGFKNLYWAEYNFSAPDESASGPYFAWGETGVPSSYTWDSYSLAELSVEESIYKMKKYVTSANYAVSGKPDNATTLYKEDDVVRTIMGGKWRMPTKAEADQLLATRLNSKYNWKEETVKGKKGVRITYLETGASIFFPYVGYKDGNALKDSGKVLFWTSELSQDKPWKAWAGVIETDGEKCVPTTFERYVGMVIRPVTK